VFIITGFAPVLGYLLYIRKIPVWSASILAISVCFLSIIAGIRFPVSVSPDIWRIVLCIYVFVAAGIPVWLILQPRDFANSFILYIGIAVIALALLIGGAMHLLGTGSQQAMESFTISTPAFNLAEGTERLGLVWPILFITIACGAISGFHSLVAGGTSSKQVCNESHVKTIGYGGMLLEGLLAVGVLSVVGAGIAYSSYKDIVFPVGTAVPGNPILAFALSLGSVLEHSLHIPRVYGTVFGILLVEGFVVTTLDTSVRLCRYLIEELWAICFKKVPKILKSYYVNAGLVVVVSYFLALTNSIIKVWPVFGAANQLLAALVLIVAAAWLVQRKKPSWFVTVPAAFMLVTSVASLCYLLFTQYLRTRNIPLIVADALLVALSAGFVVMIFRKFFFLKAAPDNAV
jgi:carbon starvation protein